MALSMESKDSPQPHPDFTSPKNADIKASLVALPNLSKEARQQHLISEIKRLVEDCDDFIGLVPGPGGVPEVVVSPNLKKDKWAIMGDAQATFREYLSMRSPSGSGSSLIPPRRRINAQKQEPVLDIRAPGGIMSVNLQRPLKRHRSRPSTARGAVTSRSRHGGGGTRVVESSVSQIRVDDAEKLKAWYGEAFLRLQQVACRLVAKVWIKKIQPKKQSTHPYNGQMPRHAPRDPTRTKPPYWPEDVQHKEPDHIAKEERTRLLVHLIMSTPLKVVTNPPVETQQLLYARDLLECLQPKRGESDSQLTEERWETIQQIIRAREMQERHARQEIDPDTLIFLCDNSDVTCSGSRTFDSDNEDEQEADSSAPPASTAGSEAVGDDHETTPDSSTRPSPIEQDDMNAPRSFNVARGSNSGLIFPGRRMATCRPRPSFPGGAPAFPVAIREGPGFASESTMRGVRGMTHGDANMLPLVGMHQQVPSTMMARFDNPPGAAEVMQVGGHGGQPATTMHVPAWSALMPDMGPDPPPELFGMSSTVTPTNMRNPYFLQQTADVTGDLHGGLHPADTGTVHFESFVEGTRRGLPFRATDLHHPSMMPTQEVSMDLMGAPFY